MTEPVCRSPRGQVVQLRAGPAIVLGHPVRLGEDQVLGDLAQRPVPGKGGNGVLLLGSGERQVGGKEEGPGHEAGDILDEAGVLERVDHALAHDDVGLEELHDDERQGLVVVVYFRDQAGRMARLYGQGHLLVVGARQGQGPALAHQAHIGQRLLDGDAARRPADDEHQIEIAVPDLLHPPVLGAAAEPRAHHLNPGQIASQAGLVMGMKAARNHARLAVHALSPACLPISANLSRHAKQCPIVVAGMPLGAARQIR
jgi:hypothetical protein